MMLIINSLKITWEKMGESEASLTRDDATPV